MSRLLDAAGDAPFVFVAGKGGVGKTTTAGALALEMADAGAPVHLISTDPAHSLADLFQQPIGGDVTISGCSPFLQLEEFDAARATDAWLAEALGPVKSIVESGTWLDAEDVTEFSRLALPGIDEMMAVLRLAELTDGAGARVVVDTAPAGHTLRLLDAGEAHASIARALRAMADKANAVAGALTGRAVRLSGEDIIDRFERTVTTYRDRVLAPAAFVLATRAGPVVEAETGRLAVELQRRHLRVAAVVCTGPAPATVSVPGVVQLNVPWLANVAGCDGLRRWRGSMGSMGQNQTSGPGPADAGPGPPADGAAAADWLAGHTGRLLLFAGKGGVGKSTCAAAAAIALSASRDVLLCSTDPAGSLADVLGTSGETPASRLRVLQIEPAAQFGRLRERYAAAVDAALERVGLSASAALDRRVIESLWDLSPPGIDELAATAAMLTEARPQETVVIDSSPTGHFLRLLEMPDVALGWTRQLMRVFVKYGIAGAAGGAAEALLDLSRQLRGLRDALRDPDATSVVIVTLNEPMVRAETDRLAAALTAAGVRIAGVLVNRDDGRVPMRTASGAAGSIVDIRAPVMDPAPVGVDALRGFVDTWNIVS